jgi:hypothetical protein
MQIQKSLSVAEISISLRRGEDFTLRYSDSSFQISGIKTDNGDERISILYAAEKGAIDFADYNEIYDNSRYYLWKIWEAKDENSYLVTLYKDTRDAFDKPYKMLRLNSDLTDVQIIDMNGKDALHPTDYLLTLIMAAYLNINRIGFLLHSAMVMREGRGYLFSGNSGDGKTTLTKLLMHDDYAEVITDERVVIRTKNESFFAYGTPWFGTTSLHKNKSAPVSKIFFIKHANINEVKRLSPIEAANRLMVRSFPAHWHKGGLQFALDFCTRIASEIACYDFGFVPDKSAIDYIQEHIEDSNNLLS